MLWVVTLPEDRATLGSDPSAGVGTVWMRQQVALRPFPFFHPPYHPYGRKALNPGGLGAEPPFYKSLPLSLLAVRQQPCKNGLTPARHTRVTGGASPHYKFEVFPKAYHKIG